MGLGDALSNIAKINPASIFAGSTPNLPGPLGSAQYAIPELAQQPSFGALLERAYFRAKSKFLPSWLKLHIPIDNPKHPLGYYGKRFSQEFSGAVPLGSLMGRTHQGQYSSFDPVGNIKSYARNYLRPNRYQVFLYAPTAITNDLNLKHISLSCSSAALPGKGIGTVDIRNGMPNVYKRPNDIIYTPVRLTFQMSEFALERELFDRWLSYIYDETTETFEYPENYYANVVIHQYDQEYNLIRKYTLEDAYPTNVSDTELSYDANDSIETFSVEMTYKKWSVV